MLFLCNALKPLPTTSSSKVMVLRTHDENGCAEFIQPLSNNKVYKTRSFEARGQIQNMLINCEGVHINATVSVIAWHTFMPAH